MEINRNVTELVHHGIRGQRWGRRRFQNQDGSLTPAGRMRYSDNGSDTGDNDYIDGEYKEGNTRYESLSSIDKLRYLRQQGYDIPRSSPKLKSTTTDNGDADTNTDTSTDGNGGKRKYRVADSSPKLDSYTFNRRGDDQTTDTGTDGNKPNTNDGNKPKPNANDGNKPNTSDGNSKKTNNDKKRWQDMSEQELREKNRLKKAQNEYKQLYGIKSQGEIQKEVFSKAGNAISNVKDITNSIGRIRSVNKPGPDYSHLSNAELQERINRISLEQRYSDLTRPKESSRAARVREAINVIGGVVAFTGSVVGIASAIKELKNP